MAMNVEAEILTQQIKALHKDLLAFENKTEQRFKHIDGRFDQVDKRFNRLEDKLDGLAKALPGIVSAAVREATRERDKKR